MERIEEEELIGMIHEEYLGRRKKSGMQEEIHRMRRIRTHNVVDDS